MGGICSKFRNLPTRLDSQGVQDVLPGGKSFTHQNFTQRRVLLGLQMQGVVKFRLCQSSAFYQTGAQRFSKSGGWDWRRGCEILEIKLNP